MYAKPCRFMHGAGHFPVQKQHGACRPSSPLPSAYKRSKRIQKGRRRRNTRLTAPRKPFLDDSSCHIVERKKRERQAEREREVGCGESSGAKRRTMPRSLGLPEFT